MFNEEVALRAYCAYGVDLIRTAGHLARATPSTIFRASTLFQRFEHSVSETVRSHYTVKSAREQAAEEVLRENSVSTCSDGNDGSSNDDYERTGEVYVLPDHVGNSMRSGMKVLTDLYAPVDYCVFNLLSNEDISVLCAACLLIAAKAEQKQLRLRTIVNVFMRLNLRRCDKTVSEKVKASQTWTEDYRASVLQAEEVVLHQLGFQIFVEAPYKYLLVYLNVLVEDEGAVHEQAQSRHSPEFQRWACGAVSWINDVPRCWRLLQFPASALAVYAMHRARPLELSLPLGWESAFGVTSMTMAELDEAYTSYLGTAFLSARTELESIRHVMSVPLLATRAQWRQHVDVEKAKLLGEKGASATDVVTSSTLVAPSPPLPLPAASTPPPPVLDSVSAEASQVPSHPDSSHVATVAEAVASLLPPAATAAAAMPQQVPLLPFPGALDMIMMGVAPPPPPSAGVPAEQSFTELQFEDLGEESKRRRLEEKQQREAKARKRHRDVEDKREDKREDDKGRGRDERRLWSRGRSHDRDRRRRYSGDRDRKRRRTPSRDRDRHQKDKNEKGKSSRRYDIDRGRHDDHRRR